MLYDHSIALELIIPFLLETEDDVEDLLRAIANSSDLSFEMGDDNELLNLITQSEVALTPPSAPSQPLNSSDKPIYRSTSTSPSATTASTLDSENSASENLAMSNPPAASERNERKRGMTVGGDPKVSLRQCCE